MEWFPKNNFCHRKSTKIINRLWEPIGETTLELSLGLPKVIRRKNFLEEKPI